VTAGSQSPAACYGGCCVYSMSPPLPPFAHRYDQATSDRQQPTSPPHLVRCHLCSFLVTPPPLPIGEPSIAISVSVCMSFGVCVCVYVCLRSYLWNYPSDLRQFLCMLPMTVARPSSCGVVIRYVLPVLWIMSHLYLLPIAVLPWIWIERRPRLLQTRRAVMLGQTDGLAGGQTDRRTDTVPLHRPCRMVCEQCQ